MATVYPFTGFGTDGFPFSLGLAQPFVILRSAMGLAIPALLDFCCIALACTAGILLYELHRPLEARVAWLLWAEISLKYGAAS